MIKLLKFKINDASYLIKLEIVFIHMIFCKYSLEYYSGVNRPDSHFGRIPHGAAERRRPSRRGTSLYFEKSTEFDIRALNYWLSFLSHV